MVPHSSVAPLIAEKGFHFFEGNIMISFLLLFVTILVFVSVQHDYREVTSSLELQGAQRTSRFIRALYLMLMVSLILCNILAYTVLN